MKGFLLRASLLGLFFLTIQSIAFSQCSFNNSNNGDLTPPGVGMTASTTGGGGNGWSVSVCAGAQYTTTTCGTSAFDTYLTVFDAAGNVLGFNDDACGSQSTVTWTSTYTGTAWVFLDRWMSNGNNCAHSGTGQPISVTQNTACAATIPPSNCGSPTVVTCGSSYIDHTTIGGVNDVNTMSCHVNAASVPIAMPGADRVYSITVAAGITTIVVTMNNVVDGNDTYVELLYLGNSCNTTTCSTSEQYDIGNGTFLNGTNTATFAAVGPGTFYFVVDGQAADGIYQYDISFDCFASGIALDDDNCAVSGGFNDANDGDINGIVPTVNGSQTVLTMSACETYTVCHTFFIENTSNWEWLDHIQMNLGSCFTNITAVTNNAAGQYQSGSWVSTVGAGTIDWEFNHVDAGPPGGDVLWGDGSGGPYNCQRSRQFCFNTVIGTGCTNGLDMTIGIILTDDGIGGSGATVVGTTVGASDNFVMGTLAPTANAGADGSTCGTTPYVLSGSIGGSATSVTWTTSGTGTFSSTTSLTPTYTPSAADVMAGTVTLTMTTNNPAGSCNAVSDAMVLTMDPPAVISAGADQLACTMAAINLAGTSTGASVTTTWTTSGTGTFSNNTSLTSTYTPSAADEAAGSVTLTLTSSDPNGLCGPVSDQMIITFDNTNPTLTCPANQASTASAGVCSRSLATPNPTVSDNCSYTLTWAATGATTLSGSGNAGTQTFNLGVTTITYTAVDPLGNTTTCSFNVTITDTQNPTITCPGNQTANTAAGVCTASVATPNPTTGDNCSIASLTWAATGATTLSGSGNAGTQTFNSGVTTVTYTVTDGAGLTATCSYTVTVTDNQNPTITCPANIAANTGAGVCTASVATPNPTVADNCAIASITWSTTGATTLSGVGNMGTKTFNLGTTTVTYVVTDASGRTATCSFTVTVTDNQNPTITCPANITSNTAAGVCTASVPSPNATIADNCTISTTTWAVTGATTLSGSGNIGTQTFNEGTNTVTYTVTDGSGNTATCSYTVTVNDNQNPTATCPANQTVVGNASCQGTLGNYVGMVTATDNCGVASITQAPAAGTVFTGTQVVTITVTDINGLTNTCTFNVAVIDNTLPTITCPANQTGNVNATCQFALLNYTGMATANDNCGAPTVTQSPAAGTLVGVGTTVVTLTATDASGNTATCTFNVVVTDVTPPIVTCPAAQTLNLNASCTATIPNYLGMVTSSDNCGIASVTQSPVSGTSVSGVGTTVVTITATDVNGNVSTCTFNVNRVDVTAPTVTCPGNQTAAANASCQFVMTNYIPLVTTSDNCSAVTVTQSPASGTTVSGTQTVTMTATDASGNTSTCTFQVVVTDNTNPVITSACPSNQTVSANASCQYVLPNYAATLTATDNCTASGSLTITQSPAAGTNIPIGATPVTVTVADANGNTATCNFTITVTDATAPVVTACPANQNLNIVAACSVALPNYASTITVTDNCSPAGSITITQSPAAGTIVSGHGTVTPVTLTITDAVGNSSTCNFNVTTVDNVAPSISCPGNQTAAANASCQFTMIDYTSLVTTSDNCAGVVTVTQSPAIGSTVSGTQTVTMTATDAAGNTATCTFQVVVNDNTNPVITSACPSDQTVNANASCQYVLPNYTASITATDNCTAAGSLTITQSPAAGTSIPSGATPVTVTVADANGNTAVCNFTITVIDASAPTITGCPSNQNLSITAANCDVALPDFTTSITVTDNCSPAASITVTQSPVAGTILTGNGTVQAVTLTVTDANGNVSTCTFNVTVVDAVNPTFVSCTPNQNETPDANCQFVLPDYTSLATVSDNCSPAGSITVTQSPAVGSTINGTSNVTLTATDQAGNTATCTFQVILTDGTPPVITSGCPANQTVNADATCAFTMTDFTGSITVTDNCNLAASITITQSPAVGATLPIGITTVTLTATDMNGNASTCTFDVIVTDVTAPSFVVCPSNQNLTITANCDAQLPDYTSTATVSDNCSPAGTITVTQSPAAGTTISGNGTVQTITLTATDADGNSATCSFDVTLVDGVAPTFVSCTPNQNEIPDANCQFTLPDYTSLSSTTDNCVTSTVTVTQSPAAGSVITGTTTITLTATDQDGNSATCTFDVILADGTPPVITSGCPANQSVNADAACGFTLTDFTGSITVTDNCNLSSSVIITQSPAAGTVLAVGITTVTLTATDLNGNASTCTFDVTVTDVTPPSITCPADILACDPVVTFTAPVGTDNCSGSTTVQTDATGLTSGSTFPVGVTTLTYTVTDASGNNVSCSFNVTVIDVTTTPNAGADLSMCSTDPAVTLTGTAAAGGNLTWYSDPALTNVLGTGSSLVTTSTSGTTIYYLSEDVSGCNSNPDSVMVTYTVCDTLQIPTGFTPDGDGTNDVWDIPGLNSLYPTNVVQVYGRWGGLLFESTDNYATPWDGTFNGKEMPVGSYYFVIDLGDGSDPIKGTVTIIE